MAEADYLQSLTTVSRVTLEPPPTPLVVKVDEDKLRTVLIELLDNALRYSPPDSPIQIRLLQQGGWAHDSDTGSGTGGFPRLPEKYI
jgi:signal transduction histidine kinase